jgi:CAAX protease family protein
VFFLNRMLRTRRVTSEHMYSRSVTVGLIGLAMGIGYVAFGRNLWPLIIAHCALNTMSMLDRVVQ